MIYNFYTNKNYFGLIRIFLINCLDLFYTYYLCISKVSNMLLIKDPRELDFWFYLETDSGVYSVSIGS